MSSTHETVVKTAIELQTGDVIINARLFPTSLYTGMVKSTVTVDTGVQINLEPSGRYIVAEDHQVEVVA